MNQTQLEVAARHYVIAALWADCPEGTNPRPVRNVDSVARERVQEFVAKIGAQAFARLMSAQDHGYGSHTDCGNVEPAAAAMGHDLWMTRQHHGVGFWDRDTLPEDLRDACTEAAHDMGEPDHEFYRGWFYLR